MRGRVWVLKTYEAARQLVGPLVTPVVALHLAIVSGQWAHRKPLNTGPCNPSKGVTIGFDRLNRLFHSCDVREDQGPAQRA